MLLLKMETQAPQLKYCLYARKSSESDERQAMSIDSQLAEMRALAQNILRQYGVERPPATPLVEYSRYVLRGGSETEKTAFANGIMNKIAVKNGELKITHERTDPQ